MKKSISAMLMIVAIFSLITTGCSVGKNEITEIKTDFGILFLAESLELADGEHVYTKTEIDADDICDSVHVEVIIKDNRGVERSAGTAVFKFFVNNRIGNIDGEYELLFNWESTLLLTRVQIDNYVLRKNTVMGAIILKSSRSVETRGTAYGTARIRQFHSDSGIKKMYIRADYITAYPMNSDYTPGYSNMFTQRIVVN